MYADDTAIYCSDKSIEAANQAMNRNLSKLVDWTTGNRLTVNAAKTKFVVFGNQRFVNVNDIDLRIGETRLSMCDKYDYLGMKLDSNLSFKPHIQSLITNCNARLTSLCKIRKYIDADVATKIYKAIILSKLQYGLVFILNATQSEQK